jgi:Leucine-rich repeat (LRR) protein
MKRAFAIIAMVSLALNSVAQQQKTSVPKPTQSKQAGATPAGVADTAKAASKTPQAQRPPVNRGVFTSLDSAFTKPDSVKSLVLKAKNLSTLPQDVVKFVNLATVDLTENYFTEIPEILFGLPKLTAVDMTSNRLKSIPKTISKASKLARLILKYNEIDTVPAEITMCANLTQLDLTANPVASMPLLELSKMKRLRTIGLGAYGTTPKK